MGLVTGFVAVTGPTLEGAFAPGIHFCSSGYPAALGAIEASTDAGFQCLVTLSESSLNGVLGG